MSQLQIQDARAVAYRALCMGALLKRGELEVSAQDSLKTADTKYHIALNQWLIDENILQHLSETEQFLLAKPLGTWSDRTLTMVGWRTEGFIVFDSSVSTGSSSVANNFTILGFNFSSVSEANCGESFLGVFEGFSGFRDALSGCDGLRMRFCLLFGVVLVWVDVGKVSSSF